MTKRFYSVFLVAALCNPASAVQLGPLQSDSYLDQPLEATLGLRDVDEFELAGLRFGLADRATYRRYRLQSPFDPARVSIDVVTDEGGAYALRIRSRDRVADPIVHILLEVGFRRGGFIRHYTIFLDPPGISPLPGDPSAGRTNARAQKTQIPSGTSAESRVWRVRGLSISMIAQNSELHPRYSVYQIMRATYLTNTRAFIDGNIEKLIDGSRLVVPDESLIAEVPRRQAIEFVRSVSRDHPSEAPRSPPRRAASEPDDTRIAARGTASTERVGALDEIVEIRRRARESGNEASGSSGLAAAQGRDSGATAVRELRQKNLQIEQLQQQVETPGLAIEAGAVIRDLQEPASPAAPPPSRASAEIRSLLLRGLPAVLVLLLAGLALHRGIRAPRRRTAELPLERLLDGSGEDLAGDAGPARISGKSEDQTEPYKVHLVAAADDRQEDRTASPEQLLLEIDVQMAYELYDEALEMLRQARQQFGDANWIDARTLEIYAATGRRREFMDLFGKKREALKSSSTIVWAEIESLRDAVMRQDKLAAAR